MHLFSSYSKINVLELIIQNQDYFQQSRNVSHLIQEARYKKVVDALY